MVMEKMLQVGCRLLDGVLDVVQVLAGGSDAVVEGVVVLGGGRRRGRLCANARVAAGLPPPPQTPEKHRGDRQCPDGNQCTDQQRHQVV